jgi:hypothetical protein
MVQLSKDNKTRKETMAHAPSKYTTPTTTTTREPETSPPLLKVKRRLLLGRHHKVRRCRSRRSQDDLTLLDTYYSSPAAVRIVNSDFHRPPYMPMDLDNHEEMSATSSSSSSSSLSSSTDNGNDETNSDRYRVNKDLPRTKLHRRTRSRPKSHSEHQS